MASQPWKDRRIVVTGGTAGFGLVLVRHLLAAGARVLVVGRSGEGVRRALEACQSHGDSIRGLTADLERPGEGRRVVGECLRILGGVDDLVCCVGRSGRGRILDATADDLRRSLDANLFSATEITSAAADDLVAARGHAIYVGSLASRLAVPFLGAYAVGKGALAAYVDAVRLELGPRGVHVLLVSPGPIGRADDDPARDRAGDRYAAEVAAAGLPDAARAPGGTSALAPLDPDRLAARVLAACRRRRCELVVPRAAGWLAALVACCPNLGRRLLARLAGRATAARR